jgi:RNA polymerase sigma factor (sigma-70 family)
MILCVQFIINMIEGKAFLLYLLLFVFLREQRSTLLFDFQEMQSYCNTQILPLPAIICAAMIDSDKELLEAIGRKDQKAFMTFYERYARLLQTWALKRTGNKELTEDIAQNFWIIIWSGPSVIKTNENGLAKDYLLRYFSYRMLDYFKSAGAQILGNEVKLGEMTESLSYTHVFEELETNEIHNLINEVIGNLPVMTREIFDLLWEKNYSVKEAAHKLNVSEKVVRTNYNKTINTLRNHLTTLQTGDNTKLQPETALVLFILLGVIK